MDVKRRIIDVVARLGSDEERLISHLRTIARVGKFIAPTRGHRAQLRMLEAAIEDDRPVIELVRRIVAGGNENGVRAVANLFLEHAWDGFRQRKRFEAENNVGVPSFVVISPLAACNLNCTGCYAGAYGDTEPMLSYEDLERIINEVRTWGSRFITLSGGEPTMVWKRLPGGHRGLRDLCAQYSDTLFLMYTNGTLIDEQMAAEMAELGNITPALSLEGYREQTDARRGDGVFDRVCRSMELLRQHKVLFGASVTYTTGNWEAVASDEFIDMLIDRGCIYAWYFMYVPVGRNPSLSLMVTPEQRAVVARQTWKWLTSRPIFVADFWNSGVLTKGCIAAGRSAGYMHITHRGDICPCVFMMYSAHNIHETDSETPLLDAVRSGFFRKIRQGQREKQNNPLAPCQIVDHPEVLKYAVESTDAHTTQEGQLILTELHEEVAERARRWREIADEIWTMSDSYEAFRESYSEGGWLLPGQRPPSESMTRPNAALRH